MSGVQRFTSPILRGFAFVRRPVSDPPERGTMCFVDDGDARGWTHRPVVALFSAGAWTTAAGRPLPFEPTHWSMIEKQPHEV